MSIIKKKFFLDNVSHGSTFRRIELELENNKFRFKINIDKSTIVIDFNDDKIIEDENRFKSIIKSVSKEIDIVEREIKQTYRKVLILENLDCANCAAKIERIAKRNLDHELIVVDFTSTRFIIETSSKDLIDNLVKEVSEITEQVDAAIRVVDKSNDSRDLVKITKEEKNRKMYFFIGLGIFAIGFIFKSLIQDFNFINDTIKLIIIYITYTLGYLLIGGDILFSALKNIKNGRIFDEKFLMSLATLTALGVGYYDEAVFVMIFYKVGELLQQYAVNYSRKSIASLFDITPEVANIVVNNVITEISPSEIMVGDILVVRPGERVPVDGVITSGEASLDTSALTGESVLKEVRVGDEILSGSINIDGNLYIKANKLYEDSMVSKILDLVQNASSQKSKSEHFISKFAKYYTPTVVIIAIVLAILIPFINGDLSWATGFKSSIMTALVFLVVSCPCALVISIPLGFFGGIGGASKRGILVKGSNYLEALNSVDTFVFDKTGTLTTGNFVVDKIISLGEYVDEELLRVAAHAEMNSSHLIAKSIIDTFGYDKIDQSKITNNRQTSSLGVDAEVDGVKVLVGRKEFLEKSKVNCPEIDEVGIIVYISINNKCEGYLVISDEIKSNSKEVIKALKDNGIRKTIMLTGDKESIAKKVSEQIGIDEYYHSMSPIDKVDKFTEIKSRLDNDKRIVYVGDGINDAPVLSRADIGIAMGSLGSDAAIEVADIVLVTDDIGKLSDALKIAKKTRRIVIQNIVLALVVKFAVLTLAIIEPFISKTVFSFMLDFLIYEAIFADVGVSLIAIVNSLRAMKVK